MFSSRIPDPTWKVECKLTLFLASYAFRSNVFVLVIVKIQKDRGSRGVKKHLIRNTGLCNKIIFFSPMLKGSATAWWCPWAAALPAAQLLPGPDLRPAGAHGALLAPHVPLHDGPPRLVWPPGTYNNSRGVPSRHQCCGSGSGSARIRNFLQDPDP
jgi:hypothetical protein